MADAQNRRIVLNARPIGLPKPTDFRLEGPDRFPPVMRQVLSKRFRIQGFIQRDFAEQRPAFYRDMAQWIHEGKVKYREDIVAGLAKAPEAFIGMLQGGNFGKLVVKIA